MGTTSMGTTSMGTVSTAISSSAGQPSPSLKSNMRNKVKGTPPLPSFSLKARPSLEDSDEARKLSKKGRLTGNRLKRASLPRMVTAQLDEEASPEDHADMAEVSVDDEDPDNVSLSDVKEEPHKSRQVSSSRQSAVDEAEAAVSCPQSPSTGSEALSSPKFAHTNLFESDVDSEDDDFFGSRPRLHNFYRYGYGSRGVPKNRPDDQKEDTDGGKPSMDGSFVCVPEDVPEDGKSPPRRRLPPRRSRGDNGEWVVLELEDDNGERILCPSGASA